MVKSPISICAIALTYCLACKNSHQVSNQITPEYDKQTGRLRVLRYDSNGDGRVDMTSTMDGSRVVSIAIDQDFDGKPDRWEYYDSSQRLVKVGSSRAHDGKEDAWTFIDVDGNVERIEISSKHDGKVQRVEHYQRGTLATAEEDTDGDGRPDKWESWENGRLAAVAFDTSHRGAPDRRLVYGAGGSARLEFDHKGDGVWAAK